MLSAYLFTNSRANLRIVVRITSSSSLAKPPLACMKPEEAAEAESR
jgi:hypothetical protein